MQNMQKKSMALANTPKSTPKCKFAKNYSSETQPSGCDSGQFAPVQFPTLASIPQAQRRP